MASQNFDTVPNLVAQHILNTAQGVSLGVEYLSASISEITPQTQIAGSSILAVTLIDPSWKIYRSGLCDQDSSGLLQQVDVNFPDGTDVWWRLAMTDITNDLTGPNLTLTFQQRIISYLQADFGPLQVASGTTTRAQFIKQLVDRIPRSLPASVLGPGSSRISFVCPDLNVIQPVATTSTGVLTIPGDPTLNALINKTPGLGANASKVLVPEQITFTNELASKTGLDPGVIGAWCLAEQSGSAAVSYERKGYFNWLNIGAFDSGFGAIYNDPTWQDPIRAADASAQFLQGTKFGASAAIQAILKSVGKSPAAQIAAIAGSGWASSGYNGGSTLRSTYQEVTGKQPSGTASGVPGQIGSATGTSDVAQLARGTADNADEDSWTCVQRLASEENWSIFSSPSPAPNVWGNYLYYIDGPAMVAQHPTATVSLSDDGTVWSVTGPGGQKFATDDGVITNLKGTTDNTAFISQENRKVHGRVMRKTRIRKPQTPSRLQFNLLSGVLEFNAGDVFALVNAGGLNGRWILEDVTRNAMADPFSQFTLGPPTAPLPEPSSTATASTIPGTATPSGVTDVSGYVNPLSQIKSLTPGRIDMGVDYSGSGTLLAVGNGTVVFSSNSDGGWPGGGVVVYQLSDGPFKGKFVYVAEHIVTTLNAGDKVKAGQGIATLYEGYPNLETGWAAGSGGSTLAETIGQQSPGDPGGWSTACGRNFNSLLVALGAPSGIRGVTPNQTMPANWPTLSTGATPGSATLQPLPSNVRNVVDTTVQTVEQVIAPIGGIFTPVYGTTKPSGSNTGHGTVS